MHKERDPHPRSGGAIGKASDVFDHAKKRYRRCNDAYRRYIWHARTQSAEKQPREHTATLIDANNS
jgi:ATP-dependent protease ClpP protease subunit